MIETARLLGGVSLIVLVVALAAWVKVIRAPGLRRLDGQIERNHGQAELASRLSLLAVAVSALAAVVAIFSWIVG